MKHLFLKGEKLAEKLATIAMPFMALFFIICSLNSLAQTNTWTQKNDLGYDVVNVPEPSARSGAVGFSIGSSGYVGTGNSAIGYLKDFWEYDSISDTWSQKADFGGIARAYAVGFHIGNKGYLGTGTTSGQGEVKDFWEYDPATNIWTQKADFGGPRRQWAVGFNILSKGYIGTGHSFDVLGNHCKDFWEYDPELDTWTQKADLGGLARTSAAAFSIGNKGYVGPGIATGIFIKDFWEFDPALNTWTQKSDYAGYADYGSVGFSIDNKGYMGTGASSTDFWEYDPISNNWTQKADFAGVGRDNAVGFSIGNKGYLGTGFDWVSSLAKDFWVYEKNTNTWSKKADFGGTARYSAVGFTIGDNGFIGLGHDGSYLKDFWQYNATANAWTQIADFGGFSRASAIGFNIGSKGYVGTGYDDYNKYKDFWEYDPATNSWSKKADFGGTARSGSVGFCINNKGYLGTGYDGTYRKDFWEYDPVSNIWTQKVDFGGGARSSAVCFSIGSKGYVGTGSNYSNFSNYYKDFWEYDPATNSWSKKADFGGTARGGAEGFCINNKGYLGTGYDGTSRKDFWEYDPSSNLWIQKLDFGGTARNAAVGISIEGKGYIGTGYSDYGLQKDLWEYTPDVCNGIIVYADTDNDGYGDIFNTYFSPDCTTPQGYLSDSSDCDDGNETVYPGACDAGNGIDDNCDGIIDNGFGTTNYYVDADGDGYGEGSELSLCENPGSGYSLNNTDCDDANSEINPGVSEVFNGLDDNCDGIIDDVACNTPTGLETKNLTATSVKFKWEYSAASYKLRYKESTTGSWTLLGPTGQTKTVEGLLANTKYVWQVKSVCNVDPKITSEWSAKQFFTTAPFKVSSETEIPSLEVYPNPFSNSATISFSLPEATHVTIELYDIAGRKLQTILDQNLAALNQEVIFQRGQLSSGLYLLQVKLDDIVEVRKLVVE